MWGFFYKINKLKDGTYRDSTYSYKSTFEHHSYNNLRLVKFNYNFATHYHENLRRMFKNKNEGEYQQFLNSPTYRKQNIIKMHPAVLKIIQQDGEYYEIEFILYTTNKKAFLVSNKVIDTIPRYSIDVKTLYAIAYKLLHTN